MPWNYVHGTNNSETINAADGVTEAHDHILGHGGDDTIFGLGGSDVLEGNAGADHLDGGANLDWASYVNSPSGVIVDLASGTGKNGDAEGDTLVNVECVIGSWFEDILIGDGGDNGLRGGGSDDVLKGGGGDDNLFGEGGDDTLTGGAGADSLLGGAGIDTAAYIDSAQGVAISLIDNLASRGDAAGDSFSSIENLTGSGHRDILRGDNGVNVLSGLDGNDTLEGLGGADTLIGGQGHDTLGQDAFLFDTGLNAATNVDLIVDFNVADDTIRLDDAVFGGLNGGTLAANQFVIGAAAQDGDDRIVYDDATGALFHHLDGAGGAAAVQFATVSAGLALTNLDFFVV